ncbi:uncharacterized protein LOC118752357 [Rhagoletis pomonella]|uniref:uncharacterized protein LOC118752357 n=1 Tax=Rhagoletis pomonella TaxID=28610 RepID=UPI00177D6007|nr:uncharacterized protein LOC118752357 [Rhagoletis pomonella]
MESSSSSSSEKYVADPELKELIKLMALKLQKEDENKKVSISVDNFNKIIPDCDGQSIPIKQWFDNFDQNAEAYELTPKQKYVQARGKVVKVAQLFLESVSVSDYETLKQLLIREFHKELSSADLHKKLSNRKKKDCENFHEYILKMEKIACCGNIEDASVIRYIVDGLKIQNEYKYALYSTKSFSELKVQYEIVERMQIVETVRKNNKISERSKQEREYTSNIRKEHCFNCGSVDHKRADCKDEPKCFRCNKSGHISKNCTSKSQTQNSVNVVLDKSRLKSIVLNGVDVGCLVDTGAYVTLLKKGIYMKYFKNKILNPNNKVLYGFGNASTKVIGHFIGTVEVDGLNVDQKFLVVPDSNIKYNALLGYDFIQKFTFVVNNSGHTFMPQRDGGRDDESQLNIHNVCEINPVIDVPKAHEAAVVEMITSYKPVDKIFECPITMKIVSENITPFRHSPSRLPPHQQEVVRKQVEEWLQQVIVRPSSSDYASRVVLTKKKEGTYSVH